MANYLERVVASGARIRPPARPAVLPPPRLPSIAAGGVGPRDTTEPSGFEPQHPAAFRDADPPLRREPVRDRQEAAGPLPEPVGTPAPPPPMPRVPSAPPPRLPDPPAAVAARPSADTVIRAPKSLRPEPGAPQVPAISSREMPGKSPRVAVLRVPRALRPSAPPLSPNPPQPVDQAPAPAEPATVPPAGGPAEALVMVPPVSNSLPSPDRTEKPRPDRPQPAPIARPIDQTSRPQLQPREPAGKPDVQGQGSRANRDTRISIGRVEVEVNNHPAPAPAPARPAGRFGWPDRLEVRYLNRFSFRP
jgi:hypothetical protein